MGYWDRPQVVGLAPGPRGGHACVAIGKQILIFGGADRTPRCYEDVWVLELGGTGAEWTSISCRLPADVAIKARTGAAVVAMGKSVYLFGGQEPGSGLCFNDLFELDTEHWQWHRVKVEGNSPPARHSCCAVCIKNECMLLFGGAGFQGPLSDVWVFNPRQRCWSSLSVAGERPAAREMAAAAMISPSRMLVFGGRAADGRVLDDPAVLDLDEMSWVQQRSLGLARCAHTMVVAAPRMYSSSNSGCTKTAAGAPGSGAAAAVAVATADIGGLSVDQVHEEHGPEVMVIHAGVNLSEDLEDVWVWEE